MHRAVLAIAASLSLALYAAHGNLHILPAAEAAPAADSAPAHLDFQAAVQLYNARQYGQALAAFQKISSRDQRNTTAALYLGNCYYALRQTQNAASYYRWIAQNYPLSAEAPTALDMLSRMGMSIPKPGSPTQPAHQSDSSSHDTGESIDEATSNVDVKSMISVVRPQGTHPGCTPAFIEEVTSALDQFPKGLMHYMFVHGCRICITPSLIDRNPELRNTRPRGYDQGDTYKNTPAMFYAPTVVVCQYAQMGDSDFTTMDGTVGVLRHEFGHAIDHFMGNLTRTETFKHIYYLEQAEVDPDYRNELHYYIQAGTEGGGASECFAEAACIVLGGNKPDSQRDKQDKHFSQSFPNVIKYVKEKIDQAH